MIPRAIRSPCVQVCEMDAATGWCLGCFRTIEEIASWTAMNEADRDAVWAVLPSRKAEILQRETGSSVGGERSDAAPQK